MRCFGDISLILTNGNNQPDSTMHLRLKLQYIRILSQSLNTFFSLYIKMSFHPEKFLNNIILRRLIISRNTLMSREVKPNRQR